MSLGSQAIRLRSGTELSAQETDTVSTNNQADVVPADDSMESVINFLEQTRIQDGSEEDELIVNSQTKISTPQQILKPPSLVINEDFIKARALSNKLDTLENKLVRFQSHEEFLRVCIAEGIVPTYLQIFLEPSIGNHDEAFLAKFFGIVKRFQNELMTATADFCAETQEKASKDINEITTELKGTIKPENFKTVTNRITDRKTQAAHMLRKRKQGKLNALRYGKRQDARRPERQPKLDQQPQQSNHQNPQQLINHQAQKPTYKAMVQRPAQVQNAHPHNALHHRQNPTVQVTNPQGFRSNIPNYAPRKDLQPRLNRGGKRSFHNFLNDAFQPGGNNDNSNQAFHTTNNQQQEPTNNNQFLNAPNYARQNAYNSNIQESNRPYNNPSYQPKNMHAAFPEQSIAGESGAPTKELQDGLQCAFQVLHALEAKFKQYFNH